MSTAGRCSDCGCPMLTRTVWNRASRELRDRYRQRGFRMHTGQRLCSACYQRARDARRAVSAAAREAEIAFAGTWRRRGLVYLPCERGAA